MTEKLHHLNSFSALPRRLLCPASAEAERGLPSPSSEAADSGTSLHAVLAGHAQADGLSDGDRELVDSCQAWKLSIVGDRTIQRRETELHVEVPGEDGSVISSGWVDEVLWLTGGTVLLIDWKTGWGEVPREAILQLQAPASVFLQDPGVKRVEGYVYMARQQDWHVSEWSNPNEALLAVNGVLKALDPTDFRPSYAACQYCRALPTCEAGARLGLDIIKREHTLPDSPEKRGQDLDRLKLAQKVIEERVKLYTKAAVEEGKEAAGYRVVQGSTRGISDTEAACNALLGHVEGLEPRELLSVAKLSLGPLERLVGHKRGVSVAKGKAEVQRILGPLLEQVPTRPYLRRVSRKNGGNQ